MLFVPPPTSLTAFVIYKNLEQIIENYQPRDFPCPYNPSTGTVDYLDNCISRILDDHGECPEETVQVTTRAYTA